MPRCAAATSGGEPAPGSCCRAPAIPAPGSPSCAPPCCCVALAGACPARTGGGAGVDIAIASGARHSRGETGHQMDVNTGHNETVQVEEPGAVAPAAAAAGACSRCPQRFRRDSGSGAAQRKGEPHYHAPDMNASHAERRGLEGLVCGRRRDANVPHDRDAACEVNPDLLRVQRPS